MSIAIYTKQFGEKLTTHGEKLVKEVIVQTMKGQAKHKGEAEAAAQLGALLASKEQDFTLLMNAIATLVRGCLDEVCQYRFKPQLSTTVHKLILVLKKLSDFSAIGVNQKPFEQCLEQVYK